LDFGKYILFSEVHYQPQWPSNPINNNKYGLFCQSQRWFIDNFINIQEYTVLNPDSGYHPGLSPERIGRAFDILAMGAHLFNKFHQLIDVGKHGLILFILQPFQGSGDPRFAEVGLNHPSFGVISFRHLSPPSVCGLLRQKPSNVNSKYMKNRQSQA